MKFIDNLKNIDRKLLTVEGLREYYTLKRNVILPIAVSILCCFLLFWWTSLLFDSLVENVNAKNEVKQQELVKIKKLATELQEGASSGVARTSLTGLGQIQQIISQLGISSSNYRINELPAGGTTSEKAKVSIQATTLNVILEFIKHLNSFDNVEILELDIRQRNDNKEYEDLDVVIVRQQQRQ